MSGCRGRGDLTGMKTYTYAALVVGVATVLVVLTAYGEMKRMIIFDFHDDADMSLWEIENDAVMGGRSESRLTLSDSGSALFSGTVSLENNGGFASMQYHFPAIEIAGHTTAHIQLRGDGKRYLLLVEAVENARHYYMAEFDTSGEWETVVIPLYEMVPMWRGDRLDLPGFSAHTLAQVRIMIANQKRESFALAIDSIWLE